MPHDGPSTPGTPNRLPARCPQ